MFSFLSHSRFGINGSLLSRKATNIITRRAGSTNSSAPTRRRLFTSSRPFITLLVTTGCTVGAILYSHYSQVKEKADMRAGVERDKERLRLKKKQQQQQQ